MSETRLHQQWYLARLSELNYPQENKDRNQHFLLPTDIYRTRWVLKALNKSNCIILGVSYINDELMSLVLLQTLSFI